MTDIMLDKVRVLSSQMHLEGHEIVVFSCCGTIHSVCLALQGWLRLYDIRSVTLKSINNQRCARWRRRAVLFAIFPTHLFIKALSWLRLFATGSTIRFRQELVVVASSLGRKNSSVEGWECLRHNFAYACKYTEGQRMARNVELELDYSYWRSCESIRHDRFSAAWPERKLLYRKAISTLCDNWSRPRRSSEGMFITM